MDKQNIKTALINIFTNLKGADMYNLQSKYANYQVSMKNLFKNLIGGAEQFSKFNDVEDEIKDIYGRSDIGWDEKNKIIKNITQRNNPFYNECINAKKMINDSAREVLSLNSQLDENRISFLQSYVQSTHHTSFQENNKVLYRSIAVNRTNFDDDFNFGMQPQVIGMVAYQDFLNLPYVNDSAKYNESQFVGWTGGYISTTASPNYAIFFSSRGSNAGKDFYLYAVKPEQILPMAEHIHEGMVVDKEQHKNQYIDGTTYIEKMNELDAAVEFVAPRVRGNEVLGCRLVHGDGSIEPLNINQKAILERKSASFAGDKEFLKYINLNHIKEFNIVEYLEDKVLFEKTYGNKIVENVKQDIEDMKISNSIRYSELENFANDLQNYQQTSYRQEHENIKSKSHAEQIKKYESRQNDVENSIAQSAIEIAREKMHGIEMKDSTNTKSINHNIEKSYLENLQASRSNQDMQKNI